VVASRYCSDRKLSTRPVDRKSSAEITAAGELAYVGLHFVFSTFGLLLRLIPLTELATASVNFWDWSAALS